MKMRNLLAILCALAFVAQSAFATDFYWDANGVAAGTGNNGTWDASSLLWRNGSSTGTLEAWPNTDPSNVDNAQLGGTAGTLTLNSGSVNINVNTITFGANYTIAAPGSGTAALNLSGTTPTIAIGTTTPTIAAKITGSDGLTKTGTGTLTLSGANTYSGGTTINAGIVLVTSDGNLGNSTGGITFDGGQCNAAISAARIVTVNAGGGAILVGKNSSFTTTGKLTGSGTLTVRNPGGNGNPPAYNFNSTANDFTGSLALHSGTAVSANSFADGAGNLVFNFNSDLSSTFTYGASAIASMTFGSRAIEINASGALTATLQNNNTTQAMTINTALVATGAGAKTLALGAASGPTNLFAGTITDGTGGGTIALAKTGNGTWVLSGTNTYTGTTTASGGTLIFQGKQALPSSSAISIGGGSTTKFLDDGTGTISFGNPISHASQNFTTTLFVGNNNTANGGNSSGTTTGSTIALGAYSFYEHSDVYTRTLSVTGANGYRLQLGDVLLFTQGGVAVADGREAGVINASTAPITVAGTVIQRSGKIGYDAARRALFDYFTLDGTGTLNRVSGTIKDALDYPSNSNATPLGVYKRGTGEWTISGTNTYSGATILSGGTLVLSGINTGSGATLLTAGKLINVVGGSCSNSDVFVSGGTNSISVTDTMKSWACRSLSYPATATLEFAFGANTPSTTVAPLQAGNVAFPVSPSVSCTGSSLPAGTYPLLTWTGFISGGAPSSVTVAGGTGVLVLDTPNKTLWLIISASSPSSKQPLTWKGPAGSEWIIGEPVYTKWQDATPAYTNYQESLVGGITVGDNVVFSNAPGGVVTLNTTVSPASVLVTGTSNYTFSGSSIGGGGALTKTGAGTLMLSSANTYSGGTRLSAGTLSLADDNALGTGGIILGGGTIQSSDATSRTLANSVVLNGSTTIGGTGNLNFNTGAGLVTAASTLTVTNSNVNATFGGPIDGAYGITKLGSGTMTLSGTNAYSGGTTVNGGTLVVNGGQNIGGGAVTIGNATHLNTMIVTNANILSGALTVGTGVATNNSLKILADTSWNFGNSAISVCRDPGNSGFNNTLIVDGGNLTNVNRISIGHHTTGGQTIRNNSMVVTNGGRVYVNGSVNVAPVDYSTGTPSLTYNSMVIASGGYLSSVGGGVVPDNNYETGSFNTIQVIGGSGSASLWNVGGGLFEIGGGSYNTITIDGAGVAGSSIVTNVGTVNINGSANSIVLTNGAMMLSANTVNVGNSVNNATLAIVGGAATSIYDAGGAYLLVGYRTGGGPVTNNQLIVGSGGVVTNVGNVGLTAMSNSSGVNTGNKIIVADGGQLYATGSILSCPLFGSGGSGYVPTLTSNSVLIANGGVVRLGGGVNIGYYVGGYAGYNQQYNSLTITNGGQLFASANSFIGGHSGSGSHIENNNSAVIGGSLLGNNASWNLGGRNLSVGTTSSGNTATNNSLMVTGGGVATNISALIVAATNTLYLGAGGQIYAVAVTNSGSMTVTIDGSQSPACGCLNVTSNLNVNAASLNISATGKPIGVFVIASYGTLVSPGVFAATNGLPDNCNLYMNYKGLKQVVIVGVNKGTVINFR